MGGSAGFAGKMVAVFGSSGDLVVASPGQDMVDLAVKEAGGSSRLQQDVMLRRSDWEALFLYNCG